MMKSFSSIRILVAVFVAALCGAGIATAQYGVQSLEGLDTTDDLRRVPIPPRDRSNDPILVVKGGTLIDGTGAAPITDATLVIQGDRILDVGRNVRVPANAARTVDASGLYIVPGLIDLHVHFTQQRGDDFAKYTDSDSAATIRGS